LTVTSTRKTTSSQSERTRMALLEAGIELAQHRAIDAISIDDIVNSAGVGKGSFFNHFGNKQNFANAIFEHIAEDIICYFEIATKDISDPLLCLAMSMQKVVDYALTWRANSITSLRTHLNLSLSYNAKNETITSIMKACVTQGYFTPEASNLGLLQWHSLCAMLMTTITEKNLSRLDAYSCLNDMLMLGLTGLGLELEHAKTVIKQLGLQKSQLLAT